MAARNPPRGIRMAPMKMELALTHRCNLRCSYCYAGPRSDRTMSLQTARLALELAFSHPHDEVRIAPFGGEPLLEPGLLDEVCTEAQEIAARTGKRVRFTITTNGTLFTDPAIDVLQRHRFGVVVSLDGDREAHDAARRFADGASSWRAAVDGLCRARDRMGTRRTLSVVHPGNVHRMAASYDALTALGVDQLSFAMEYGAAWTDEHIEALRQGFEAITDRTLARYRAGEPVIVRPLHGKIARQLRGDLFPGTRCRFGLGEVAVAPSGRLYPCERLIGADGPAEQALAIGDVHEGIDLTAVTTLRACKNRPRPDCETCAVFERCMWWCGCINRTMTGRIDGIDGRLCEMEQIVIAAADRLASTLYAERNPAFLKRYYEDTASRYGLI